MHDQSTRTWPFVATQNWELNMYSLPQAALLATPLARRTQGLLCTARYRLLVNGAVDEVSRRQGTF